MANFDYQITCITKPDRNNTSHSPFNILAAFPVVKGGEYQKHRQSPTLRITNTYSSSIAAVEKLKSSLVQETGENELEAREDDDTHDNLLSLPECP